MNTKIIQQVLLQPHH